MTESNGANLGFESDLWRAADALRYNTDPSAYQHVVLALDRENKRSYVERIEPLRGKRLVQLMQKWSQRQCSHWPGLQALKVETRRFPTGL
jgi:hypothetical protein